MALNFVRYIVDREELDTNGLSPDAARVAAELGVERGITPLKIQEPDDEWLIEIEIEAVEAFKDERQLEMGFERAIDWSDMSSAMKAVRVAVAQALAEAGRKPV